MYELYMYAHTNYSSICTTKERNIVAEAFYWGYIISSSCDTCIVSNVTFLGPSLSQKRKSDNAAVSYPLGVISVWHVLTIHVYQNTSKWTVHYQVLPVCQPFNGPPPPPPSWIPSPKTEHYHGQCLGDGFSHPSLSHYLQLVQ